MHIHIFQNISEILIEKNKFFKNKKNFTQFRNTFCKIEKYLRKLYLKYFVNILFLYLKFVLKNIVPNPRQYIEIEIEGCRKAN